MPKIDKREKPCLFDNETSRIAADSRNERKKVRLSRSMLFMLELYPIGIREQKELQPKAKAP